MIKKLFSPLLALFVGFMTTSCDCMDCVQNATIHVTPDFYSFPSSGGVATFTVLSSAPWSINPDAVPAWCTFSPESGPVGSTVVTVTALEHTALTARGLSTIPFIALTGSTVSVVVTQGEAPGVIAVAAGIYHSLAIKDDGSLWGWGQNNVGQFGDGTTTSKTVPTLLNHDRKYKAIAASAAHSLALDVEGNLWAWGSNQLGASTSTGILGDGTRIQRLHPVPIMEGTIFTQISTSLHTSFAIDEHGQLWGWGHPTNLFSLLGNGTAQNVQHLSPIKIMEGTVIKQVSAGMTHTLAIDEDGQLWGWGENYFGQIGNGTTTGQSRPVKVTVPAGTKFVQISAKGGWPGGENGGHSLAIEEGGQLWVWGWNSYGEQGRGSTGGTFSTPGKIMTGTVITQISAGRYHNMALDKDGNIYTWGRNNNYQIGDETTTNRNSPQLIGTGFKMISAGGEHNLAIDAGGHLFAWGQNDLGQVGNGTTANQMVPAQIIPFYQELPTTP